MPALISSAVNNECGDESDLSASSHYSKTNTLTDTTSEGGAISRTALSTKLAKTIEGEIIPRLLLAHQSTPPPPSVRAAAFDFSEIEIFSAMVYAADGAEALHYISQSLKNGRSIESLIMDLLAPTAAHLGDLWKADLCSFTQVTIGLSTLRHILREIGPDFENEMTSWRHNRRILLLPTPGEQHTFGICVVEAFFRREGWDVCNVPIDTVEQISQLVAKQWFAIAGFSLSSEYFIDRLTPLIRAVRHNSCNRDIGILVGGSLFCARPDLIAHVGADASAADGRIAVHKARALLPQRSALR